VTDDTRDRDLAAIRLVVQAFFAAFTSGPGSSTRLGALRALLLPEAVIVRTGGAEPLVHGVEEFIAPREALLGGGALVDFSEWPLAGRTEVFGDVAHWFGGYEKAGVHDGAEFTGRGMMSLQLVRTSPGWRISAAAWDDEREGLSIPTTPYDGS
jgi:hypothetical protein